MPHRLVCYVIVGFWLGTTGVLLLRQWQQCWQTPPSLAETVTEHSDNPVEWQILRRCRGPDETWESPCLVGVLVSQVHRDEQSGVISFVHQLELELGQIWHHFPMPESAGTLRMESRLEVGLLGELQRLRIVGGWSAWSRWLILLEVVPRPGGEAALRWMLNLPNGVVRQEHVLPWSVTALPANSLGPPDRLPGLRPGQRWALPWVDVLNPTGSLGGLVEGVVEAQPVPLNWQGDDHLCWLVRWQRNHLEGQWWVAQSGPRRDQVLQQVIRWSDMELLLVRQAQLTRKDLLVSPAWFYRLP